MRTGWLHRPYRLLTGWSLVQIRPGEPFGIDFIDVLAFRAVLPTRLPPRSFVNFGIRGLRCALDHR